MGCSFILNKKKEGVFATRPPLKWAMQAEACFKD